MTQPTSDEGLFDIMWTCRAMRRFKPDPVPEELLLQLVDAALHGPSGSNAQNWRFVIVRDRAQKEKVQKIWQKTWGFYLDTFATAGLDLVHCSTPYKQWDERPRPPRHLYEPLGWGKHIVAYATSAKPALQPR